MQHRTFSVVMFMRVGGYNRTEQNRTGQDRTRQDKTSQCKGGSDGDVPVAAEECASIRQPICSFLCSSFRRGELFRQDAPRNVRRIASHIMPCRVM